jgi:hypothetical protein
LKKIQDSAQKISTFAVKATRASKYLETDVPRFLALYKKQESEAEEKLRELKEGLSSYMIIVGQPGPGKYFGELALQFNSSSSNKIN